MSDLKSNINHTRRNRLLSSVAALALVVSGTVAGTVMSSSTPVRAAAVLTSDLQSQALPFSQGQTLQRFEPGRRHVGAEQPAP
jgi:hypothetical protein